MLNEIDTFTTKVYHRNELNKAAEELRAGKLVAFPTETVYGLGAIANNEAAVASVFSAKGRPQDNPLIVHVSSMESVEHYVTEVNSVAKKLMESFWPGPLTIIFPVKEGIFAKNVTANLTTVGMRMPRQLETLLTIEMVGFPLVGPSANLSGKPSPTSVEHVLHDLNGKITGVIANPTELTDIGVESTVVLPERDKVTVLRPGAITTDMLSEIVDVSVNELSSEDQIQGNKVISPGVKYNHYSPKQPVYLVQSHHTVGNWKEIINDFNVNIGILATDDIVSVTKEMPEVVSYYSLGAKEDIRSATHHLFAGLRYLEMTNCDIIIVQGWPEVPQAHAYMNRLNKASNHVI